MSAPQYRVLSFKPLIVQYDNYKITVEYGVGDELGFVVEIDEGDKRVVRRYVRKVEQVTKLIAERINAVAANFVTSTLNSLLRKQGLVEPEDVEYELRTEYMIYPIGALSERYYYLTEAGWREAHVEEGGEIVERDAMVKQLFAPSIANFLYHLPPASMDFSVLFETDKLLEELAMLLGAYISARREYLQLAAVWALLTYTRHAFRYAEYLRIHKTGFGSGGTTAAKVVSLLSARSLRPLIATTAAAFMRVVHVAKPAVVVDEIREEELDKDMLNTLKLFVESAFDADYLVARVIEGEVKDFSLYSNVVVVDTSFKFTTLSAERRAWTFRIERNASKVVDLDLVLEDAKRLTPRLYAWGIAFSLWAREYIRKYRNMQGIGAVEALYEFMRLANMDTSIVAATRELIKSQLADAYDSAVVTDPVTRILNAVEEEVEGAVKAFKETGVAPERWHIAENNNCIYIYVDTLRRLVAARFRKLHEITVQVEMEENRSVELKRQSQWYRVEKDVEPYLDMKKFISILKMRYPIRYVSRNPVLVACALEHQQQEEQQQTQPQEQQPQSPGT